MLSMIGTDHKRQHATSALKSTRQKAKHKEDALTKFTYSRLMRSLLHQSITAFHLQQNNLIQMYRTKLFSWSVVLKEKKRTQIQAFSLEVRHSSRRVGK